MTAGNFDFDATKLRTKASKAVAANECDDNGHLNVQHYVERIDNAVECPASSESSLPKNNAALSDMHLRFHRELLVGTGINVHSGLVDKGPHAGKMLHLLTADGSSFPCATALETPKISTKSLPKIGVPLPKIALPRSLPFDAYRPVDTEELFRKELARVREPQLVKTKDCNESGCLKVDSMVGHFFHAAMHLWGFAGFERNWFQDNGYGGIALEMKLTRFAEIRAGDHFTIVSWVPRLTSNMLDLANQLVEMPSGKPIARICAASMIFDRESRQPVNFPESIQDRYNKRFEEFRSLDA